jgi:hypothetical protein
MTGTSGLSTPREPLFVTTYIANVAPESAFEAVYEFSENLVCPMIVHSPSEGERTKQLPIYLPDPICELINWLPVSRVAPTVTLIPSNRLSRLFHPVSSCFLCYLFSASYNIVVSALDAAACSH